MFKIEIQDVSGVLNGSVDLGDDADGRRAAIEHMHNKIARTRELIKGEQTARDGMLSFYHLSNLFE